MKKLSNLALLATAIFVFSCNPKDNNADDNKDDNNKEDIVNNDKDDEQDDFDKAAVAYCDCYQKSAEDIPSGLKKLIKNASKAEDPESSMREDYMNLSEEEQKAFDDVMAEGSDMNKCFDKVKKKYKFDDKDVATLKKLKSKVAKQEDCGFVNDALTLAISMENSKKNNRNNNNNDDDVTEE